MQSSSYSIERYRHRPASREKQSPPAGHLSIRSVDSFRYMATLPFRFEFPGNGHSAKNAGEILHPESRKDLSSPKGDLL